MVTSRAIIKYLEDSGLKYDIVKHKTVYTAFDKAATLKVKPDIIGKTLILKSDKELLLAVIPGDKNLDRNKLKKIVNIWRKKIGQKSVRKIDFITETVMKNKFKGSKSGALPPFGSLWDLPTFTDKKLMDKKKIIINGGDYKTSFGISPSVLKKSMPDIVIGQFSKKK